ncbi:hypothetical protein BD289DRAFT_211203 [Coniella lustricola]|uniref:Uncharacterized protein n=1 Tax=Coniella lustricola TaxID=2025994 RepID=A0A2T3ABT3_9PEZI|nr:hypothetical protein BD289DRAFT_211203 [Coniella lustricola]
MVARHFPVFFWLVGEGSRFESVEDRIYFALFGIANPILLPLIFSSFPRTSD